MPEERANGRLDARGVGRDGDVLAERERPFDDRKTGDRDDGHDEEQAPGVFLGAIGRLPAVGRAGRIGGPNEAEQCKRDAGKVIVAFDARTDRKRGLERTETRLARLGDRLDAANIMRHEHTRQCTVGLRQASSSSPSRAVRADQGVLHMSIAALSL